MTSSVRRRTVVPVLIALAAACASTRIERQLDAKSRDFVSKARYIITADERKTFLALPAEAREEFVADFWRRRDPSPLTAENEFKLEYFKRIELSNRLFSGGASPGWLQDRGRVWITLGPPDNRETYPRGVTFYGVPTEIWWYGFFPIVFVDERWIDDYRLDPSSATQLTSLTQAQYQWNLPVEGLAKDYGRARPATLSGLEVRIEKDEAGSARFVVVLPYRNIWMKSKGDRFEARLDVDLRVVDGSGAEVWSFSRNYPLEVLKDRLKTALTESFTAEAVAPLKPGSYRLKATVVNGNDGSKASFEQAFDL